MNIKKILSIILIFFILTGTVPSYAGVTSTSDGDGKSIEFQLVESTPKESATDVELNTEIFLLFNKNVVNLSVKENNSKCISLYDSNGQLVPIEIIFPDDQIEPDKKRQISVKPQEDLIEGMTYSLEISKDFQAKNGSTLEDTVYISFTTLSSALEEESGDTSSIQVDSQPKEETPDIKSVEVESYPVNSTETFNEDQDLVEHKNEVNDEEASTEQETVPSVSTDDTVENAPIVNINDAVDEAKEIENTDESVGHSENRIKFSTVAIVIILIVVFIFVFIKFIKRKP